MLPCLDESSAGFPPTSQALEHPNGLLAFGGDLGVERLLDAYHHGIFPWFEDGQPILWWSPEPRMVLFPSQLHVSRTLHKVLKRHFGKSTGPEAWHITVNHSFNQVIAACSGARPYTDSTWITAGMIKAYQQLHRMGYAVSVEVRDPEGSLLGGLYGLALGGIFFGESMFSLTSGASKTAFVYLVRLLASWQYRLIDCQVSSDYLASFGAETITRKKFEALLPAPGPLPAADRRWQEAPPAEGLLP